MPGGIYFYRLGGGGRHGKKCSDVCVEGSENVPIMRDALGQINTFIIV